MIPMVPDYLSNLFGMTVLVSIIWFHFAFRSRIFLYVIIAWTIFQSILGLAGVYQDTSSVPPRILLFGVLPTLAGILILLFTRRGRKLIDRTNLKTLTYFHSIRIPVELVLALLYYHGAVSVYMTFEGTNLDLLSGITAPIVAFLAFRHETGGRKLLLIWNSICLLLLLNVVITAVFALPSPFQKLSLEQPNIAVLYFPFNLLPTVVVPLVLFGHLIAFRQLFSKPVTIKQTVDIPL